jgi:hypothetical protein
MTASSLLHTRGFRKMVDCTMEEIEDCVDSAKKLMRDFINLIDANSNCDVHVQAPGAHFLKPLLLGATAVIVVIISGSLVYLIYAKKLCAKTPLVYERMNTVVLSNIHAEEQ